MSAGVHNRLGWFLGAGMLLVANASAEEPFKDCAECPRMVRIHGGTFTMGSPMSEPERRKFEGPQSNVRVERFALTQTEVTVGEYAAFVRDTKHASTGCYTQGDGTNDIWSDDKSASWRSPAFEQTDAHPVVCVSWLDAKDYAAWLSHRTGRLYRLPSEAEWEYAARAGTTSTYFWGDSADRGCEFMNGGDPSLLRALPTLKQAIEKARRHGLWLLLLLGLRSTELLNARWSDIDWDTGTLFVGLTKNGEPLLAPLGGAALTRLKLIPRIPNNPYIICGQKPGRPLTGLGQPLRRALSLVPAPLGAAESRALSVEDLLQPIGVPSRHRHYFKREDLHELVWTAPVSEVAGRLGVSDVALAKRWVKQTIPRRN